MDFIDQIQQFSKRANKLKNDIQTEEATKTAIVMPFFQLLGYDVFSPQEFTPEFTCDVGIKKGEKVDYAIIMNGQPVILIEAKSVSEPLDNHNSQLYRYFGVANAKFAILTNGIIYKFFTDLEEQNKMDSKPFFEVNILDVKDYQVSELKKFHKSVFRVDEVLGTAEELKFAAEFKSLLKTELQNPTDAFVRFFLQDTYVGQKTQNVIERFRPILKKSLNDFISEMMNDKIKSALASNVDKTDDVEASNDDEGSSEDIESTIETTAEELEAFYLIKHLLKDQVEPTDITFKDTKSYMNVLHQNNTWKWICRLYFGPVKKLIVIPIDKKNPTTIELESIYDIEDHIEKIKQTLDACKN